MKNYFMIAFIVSSLALFVQESQTNLTKGKQLTIDHACTACHKERGPLHAPGFSGIGWKHKKADKEYAMDTISKIIAQGSKGQYPHFNKSIMPPYAYLPEKDRLAIATYILSLSNKKVIKK